MSVQVARLDDGQLALVHDTTAEPTVIPLTDDEARQLAAQLRAHTVDPVSEQRARALSHSRRSGLIGG